MGPNNIQQMTVMAIDDAVQVRNFLLRILSNDLGISNVLLEDSGGSALRHLNGGTKVDLVISDWEMPGISGFALLTEIRKREEMGSLPFLMMTSRADRNSIIMAKEAGVSDYIIKPFTPAVVIQKVQGVLSPGTHRKDKRVSIRDNIMTEVSSGQQKIPVELINISAGGCQVLTKATANQNWKIYDQMTISIATPEETLNLTAQLLRMEGSQEQAAGDLLVKAAFRFVKLEHNSTVNLKRFIEHYQITQPTTAVAPH